MREGTKAGNADKKLPKADPVSLQHGVGEAGRGGRKHPVREDLQGSARELRLNPAG